MTGRVWMKSLSGASLPPRSSRDAAQVQGKPRMNDGAVRAKGREQ